MKTTGPTDLTKLDDAEIITRARDSVMNLSNMAPLYVHELTRRLTTLAAIRAACNLRADMPHGEMAEAIRQRMTVRPSKEAIRQMVTYEPSRAHKRPV